MCEVAMALCLLQYEAVGHARYCRNRSVESVPHCSGSGGLSHPRVISVYGHRDFDADFGI